MNVVLLYYSRSNNPFIIAGSNAYLPGCVDHVASGKIESLPEREGMARAPLGQEYY